MSRERARELEEACDFVGASRAALEAGDARWAARLAALGRDVDALGAALDALEAEGPAALISAGEDLLARGFGLPAGELFERGGALERAGAALAQGGDAIRSATAYERAGKPAEGARVLERALKVDPTLDRCKVALGELLLRHGRLEQAAKALQAVPHGSDERHRALPPLARALGALGLHEAAREVELEAKSLGVDLEAPAPVVPSAIGPTAAGTVLFGRFEIVRSVAKTPHAEVLEAIDRMTHQRVAVKLLASGASGTGRDAFTRFEREARALRELKHATTVPLLGYYADGPAMVLEWMSGGSLADLSKAETFAPARAAEIACAVLTALGEAHRRGILHRDVKPTNVLFDAIGAPRLSDFGAAHLGDLSTTVTAGAIGTFAYMAPEQRLGRPATVASDVYAVGAIFFEMLTGLPAEPTPHGELTERAPSAYHDDLGPQHDAVIGRMLAADPDQRPADAFEARRAIEGVRWSTRVLQRSIDAVASTRSSRPPPDAERLAAPRDLGDGRDAGRLRFDTLVERHVLVVPLEPASLALARALATSPHPALPLVLRGVPEDGELWIEAPRGQAIADGARAPRARAVLRSAIEALHSAGGAHGCLDASHVYVHEGALTIAWPRELGTSVDAARASDVHAIAAWPDDPSE